MRVSVVSVFSKRYGNRKLSLYHVHVYFLSNGNNQDQSQLLEPFRVLEKLDAFSSLIGKGR